MVHIYTSPLGPCPKLPEGNAVNGILQSQALNDPSIRDRKLFVNALTHDSYTCGDFISLVPRAAGMFRHDYGIEFGDFVALFAVNDIFTSPIHMGVVSLGAIITPANVQYNAEELAHQLKMTKPKILIVFDPLVKTGEEAVKIAGLQGRTKLVTLGEIANKMRALIKNPSAPAVYPVKVDMDTHLGVCCFSSGTSGLPKGVMTTHTNIISNTLQVSKSDSPLKEGEEAVLAAVLPMSHIYGLQSFIWLASYQARPIIVFPRFDLKELLEGISRYDITTLVVVPPIVLLFAKHPLVDEYPKFKTVVKYILSGAAPLSKSTVALLEDRVPNIICTQGYGLTETSPVCIVGGSGERFYDNATCGYLVPGTEARLVDPETGKDSAPGERGELWLRGPNVMKGYLDNPKATAESITSDRWFKTGDVACVDEHGQFSIVDRIKELIKSKGHQVAPAELEGILLTNPHVVDVAVVGVPDEHQTTELPRAFLSLRDPSKLTEVIQWFNKRVAIHKRLWGGAVLMEVIPKSPSGKILRRFLRDRKSDEVVGQSFAKL